MEYVTAVEAGVLREVERRELTPDMRLQEALFTALRLTDGVALAAVRDRYGVDLWARYGSALQPFVDGGWVIYDGGVLRLSRAGMLVAHDVMAVFLP
jgi:coproporphyrinogen III oxidase-like Fe-S oxidoreductase